MSVPEIIRQFVSYIETLFSYIRDFFNSFMNPDKGDEPEEEE